MSHHQDMDQNQHHTKNQNELLLYHTKKWKTLAWWRSDRRSSKWPFHTKKLSKKITPKIQFLQQIHPCLLYINKLLSTRRALLWFNGKVSQNWVQARVLSVKCILENIVASGKCVNIVSQSKPVFKPFFRFRDNFFI